MSEFDAPIIKMIEMMMAAKNCQIEDNNAHAILTDAVTNHIRTIGLTASRNATHAGRCKAVYFDLEIAFKQLGIRLSDLEDSFYNIQLPSIEVNLETISDDKGVDLPAPLLGNASLTPRNPAQIPDHLPPFPNQHTYLSSKILAHKEKTYQQAREIRANNIRAAKNALVLNDLRTSDKIISVLSAEQLYPPSSATSANQSSLHIKPRKRPAFLDALVNYQDEYLKTDENAKKTADKVAKPSDEKE